MKNTTKKSTGDTVLTRAVDEETVNLLSKRCADYLYGIYALPEPKEQVTQRKKQTQRKGVDIHESYSTVVSEKPADSILQSVKASGGLAKK